MEKPKFTPGPWKAEPGAKRGAWVKGATGEWAALACGDTDESASANARLIAEAPNMYATLDVTAVDLDLLRRAIEDGDPKAKLLIRVKDMQERHRRALSKAEGRG